MRPDSSRCSLSQQVFELGKDLFDRVEVGRVFGQEEELGAGRADELTHGFALVAAEIVHDDDVAFAKRRQEDIFQIGSKVLAVDRPVKKPRSEEHTSELQSLRHLVCRLLLEKE